MISVTCKTITLNAEVVEMGNDLTVTVTGGDTPHLGAVALAEPHPGISDPAALSATVSVLNRTGHRDGVIAERMAKQLAIAHRSPVCVTCGIHFDSFSPDCAKPVIACSDRLTEQIIALF